MPPDKLWRECISNHLRSWKFAALKRKEVARRESLKQSCFTKRDGAMLAWVQEAALGRVAASPGDGRGHVVPRHATVNVFEPVALAVAIKLVLIAHVQAASAIARDAPNQRLHLRLLQPFQGPLPAPDEEPQHHAARSCAAANLPPELLLLPRTREVSRRC